MIKFVLRLVAAIFFSLPVFAQEEKEANATSIIENEYLRYNIGTNNHLTTFYSLKVKILDKSAIDDYFYGIYYDNSSKILQLQAVIYDEKGNQVRKIGMKDFEDRKVYDGISFHDDNRVKQTKIHYNIPYTVEFLFEKEYEGVWMRLGSYAQPSSCAFVRKSTLVVNTAHSEQVRFFEHNFDYHAKPVFTKNGGQYKWVYTDIPVAPRKEGYIPENHSPRVIIAANKVFHDKFSYKIQTWEDMGNFYARLNRGRQTLPKEAKAFLGELCQGKSESEKIRLLYEYLQKNYRYVSIQLGIGGLQSFTAETVWKNKYGDCKALSNLMQAMLKEVGIESYPVMIRGSRKPHRIKAEEVYDDFNHIILCALTEKDTVWLECTSDNLPAGFLGDFTSSRTALLCKIEKSHLVKTPEFSHNDNRDERYTTVKINGETFDFNIKAKASGFLADDFFYYLKNADEELKRKTADELTKFPIKKLNHFALNKVERQGGNVIFPYEISGTGESLFNTSGKRIFIDLTALRGHYIYFPDTAKRNFDIEAGFGFSQTDTVEVLLPGNYLLESKQNDFSLSSFLGSYNFKAQVEGNVLKIFRQTEWYGGLYDKAKHEEMRTFAENVRRFEQSKFVLRKAED
jgi:hypothetical protein